MLSEKVAELQCPHCHGVLSKEDLFSAMGTWRAKQNKNPGRKRRKKKCPACKQWQPSVNDFKEHWRTCPERTDRRQKRVA